jgi:hypothetical protein
MKKGKVLNLFGDTKIGQNKEEKYSTLLEKFISPFAHEFIAFEYQEDIFDFAISAWNFGNMSAIIDKKEFKEILSLAKDDAINYPLLKKMIAHKVSNFKEFTNFIVDFEIEQIKDILKLTVATEKEESYMTNLLDGASEPASKKDDFEENFINRSAISLKPLQPFIDWHNAIYPDSKIDESFFNEVNIYLINNSNFDDIEAYLKKKFDRYFMMELDGWHTNKKEWPQRRTYKVFKEWFRIDISTAVYDLEKKPVSKA